MARANGRTNEQVYRDKEERLFLDHHARMDQAAIAS